MIGTRATLRSWLSAVKGLTYTKYSKLDTVAKLKLMKEYRGH